MLLLVVGLVLFLGVHAVPMRPAWRDRLARSWGEKRYRGLFSLVSALGFVLLVIGKGHAPYVHVFTPPAFGRTAAYVLLAGTALCFAGMYLPTNLKRLTAHPMLWGTAFWGLGHLLANGDLASLVLFGSFLLYALLDMVSANRRGARPKTEWVPVYRDAIVLALGGLLYVGALYGHPYFAGARL